jgi:hypothetical protein
MEEARLRRRGYHSVNHIVAAKVTPIATIKVVTSTDMLDECSAC